MFVKKPGMEKARFFWIFLKVFGLFLHFSVQKIITGHRITTQPEEHYTPLKKLKSGGRDVKN